jgi:hypothetical protein
MPVGFMEGSPLSARSANTMRHRLHDLAVHIGRFAQGVSLS